MSVDAQHLAEQSVAALYEPDWASQSLGITIVSIAPVSYTHLTLPTILRV